MGLALHALDAADGPAEALFAGVDRGLDGAVDAEQAAQVVGARRASTIVSVSFSGIAVSRSTSRRSSTRAGSSFFKPARRRLAATRFSRRGCASGQV
jgi:hypothetical protein